MVQSIEGRKYVANKEKKIKIKRNSKKKRLIGNP